MPKAKTNEAPKKNKQAKEVWRRFKKNKLAVLGLVIIIVLILAAVFAPVIAPYGYDDQDYGATFIKFSKDHPLGTDNLGRDILSRLLYGSRVSLTIGFISVGIGLIAGGLIGAIAGYYGGVLDDVLMRIIDIIMAIPSIILAISVCAALGPGLINTMIAVGISSIPNYARILRSSILSIKQQEFVEAAKFSPSPNTLAFDESQPVSILVDTQGTGKLPSLPWKNLPATARFFATASSLPAACSAGAISANPWWRSTQKIPIRSSPAR